MRSHTDAEENPSAEVTPPLRPTAPWRVAQMEVLPGFRLRVRFKDGTEGTVELAEFLHSASAGVFAALRDENLFCQARIELGAVVWPDNLDLAPDAMHREIKEHGTWIVR
jgi:Protein of unknown function (DUF2442)